MDFPEGEELLDQPFTVGGEELDELPACGEFGCEFGGGSKRGSSVPVNCTVIEFDDAFVVTRTASDSNSDKVVVDNAVKLAARTRLFPGCRYDVLTGGRFVFGDYVEAVLRMGKVKAERMLLSTLSMNAANVDSLAGLIADGLVESLDLLISGYFASHERGKLLPYIKEELMGHELVKAGRASCRVGISSIHTKTCQVETAAGHKLVMHGSGNLRSSGSIETLTIEDNPGLYDFYAERLGRLVTPRRRGVAETWEMLSGSDGL